MTVIVTAGLALARVSNALLAFVIAGSGSSSTVMVVVGVVDVVVVDVVVVDVVVVDVVVDVVDVVVVADVVVVVALAAVVESMVGSTGAEPSELAADRSEHAVVRMSPTRRAIVCQRTPSR